jgi:N-acetyl-anhydromuramyl-L-alanine amidase AmpD
LICQDLTEDLPRHSTKRYRMRSLAGIKYLVIHHTGVDADSTPSEIARYHVNVRDWPGIGYHFVVSQDGTIYQTNNLATMAYNVARRNHEVVGICLPGDFNTHPPRKAQIGAARKLLEALRLQLPKTEIVGHREIALPGHETTCPGDTFLAGPRWKVSIYAQTP